MSLLPCYDSNQNSYEGGFILNYTITLTMNIYLSQLNYHRKYKTLFSIHFSKQHSISKLTKTIDSFYFLPSNYSMPKFDPTQRQIRATPIISKRIEQTPYYIRRAPNPSRLHQLSRGTRKKASGGGHRWFQRVVTRADLYRWSVRAWFTCDRCINRERRVA